MIKRFTLLFLLLSATITLNAQGIMFEEQTSNNLEIKKIKDKYALVTTSGKALLSELDSIIFNDNTNIYLVKKNGLWGMTAKTGYITIPMEFDLLKQIFNEFWLVKKNNKQGVYSRLGNLIIPAEYESIEFTFKIDKEFKVKKDNMYGIINSNGTLVIPIKYESILRCGDVLLALKLKNKTEYSLGDKIIRDSIILNKTLTVYGNYPNETKNYFAIQRDSKYEIIDSDGSVIIHLKYQDISSKRIFYRTKEPVYLYAKLNNLWGAIDLQDNILVPFEYKTIELIPAIVNKQ